MKGFKRIDNDFIETLVADYQKGERSIGLVGVFHIGSSDYYNKIQDELSKYPPGFYEGIIAPDRKLTREEKAMKKVDTKVKKYMAKIFGVTTQNKNMNPSHWRNVDIKGDNLLNDYEELGVLKFMAGMILSTSGDVIKDHFRKNISKDSSSPLFVARNNIICEAISKSTESLGLLYGASHMPVIGQYLEDNGFEVTDEKWIQNFKVL